MEKPKPKFEVKIDYIKVETRGVSLYASADAIEDFKEFGHIQSALGKYYLVVDARYDFNEVLKYIEQYDRKDN